MTNISHSTQVESVTTSRVRWRCLRRSIFHAEKVDCAQEAEAEVHGTNAGAGEQAGAAGATVSGTAQARALGGYCGVCLRAQTWPYLPDKQGRRVDELGHRGGNCSERHGGCGEEEAAAKNIFGTAGLIGIATCKLRQNVLKLTKTAIKREKR